MMGPRNQRDIVALNEEKTIDGYDTRAFAMRNLTTGVTESTVWAADVDEVPGARTISKGLLGMYGVMKAYMEKTGVAALTGTSTFAAIMEKMEDHYPILRRDDDGSETRLSDVKGKGNPNFVLECRERVSGF